MTRKNKQVGAQEIKRVAQDHIRNFAIIAHIDHGKSTLADRLIELTGALPARDLREQVLDTMDLERERGITIKAQTARLNYESPQGELFVLNLIDTPGHVDFAYEVSRSLAACEGALLVVDASQGVEAQTLANVYLALQHDLVIIPVINKIDLPQAQPKVVLDQLESMIGLSREEALLVSAKTGEGVPAILEAIIHRLPPPQGKVEAPLRALLFDAWLDAYRGVVVLVRVMEGVLRPGSEIVLMSTSSVYEVEELGVLTPRPQKVDCLLPGEVGYLMAGIKELRLARIGETITSREKPAADPLPGFQEPKPMVFSGFYPAGETSAEDLKSALDKLKLNDFSFTYEPESSPALGLGFRCGFLGLLHRDIIQERLEREFGVELISTAPMVEYLVDLKNGRQIKIQNPSQLPPLSEVKQIKEPIIEAIIITPDRYLGEILKLAEEKRGVQKKLEYISAQKVVLTYQLPLNEVVVDFYPRLKSLSQGYASLDYEFIGYQPAELVRLDILINRQPVDSLSLIVHRDKAYVTGKKLVKKLREAIPRQQFEVALQAAIGHRIIARETIKPYRKDVLAKLYGGDYTRKMKLLEKQKAGKKRMRRIGRVDVPQEAFLAILNIR
ncbi:MAG: translation elongation factor 4 [Candidatus Aminicenantes bacterium]|nr:translation elongation factor 4 [Candidatus Aminicenantes bacterium]